MNRIYIAIFVALAFAATVFFAYPYLPKHPPKASEVGWTGKGVKDVVNANNKFAFELYSELSKSKENIFFSPYSISSAFAIVYEGARSKTAEEIKSVFHFPEYEILRPNFARIYNQINAYKELRTGNALWVQKNFTLLEDYKGTAEKYYGAKAANLDFINEPEKSRQTINKFIEEQTEGKIKELIPRNFITRSIRLVITNAIYFKGEWKWKFDKEKTREEYFYTPSKRVKVKMMYMKPEKARFNYAETDKLQILELPYKSNISMLIILPRKNYTLEDIELSMERFNDLKDQMRETKLDAIYLPKFEFKTKYLLNDNLKNLGILSAFGGGADFSGMTGIKNLCIDFVIHQAYVKVDEEGTEAAAATAIGMKLTAIRKEKIFKADHPFIFIIQERNTGNILFIGRVLNPNEKYGGNM